MRLTITLFLCFFASTILAQSEAGFRSIVFPGWGQFYNLQPTKGYIIIGAEVASLGSYFYFNNEQNKKYNEYSLTNDPILASQLFEDVEKNKKLKNISLGIAAGVWLFSIIDAYLNYDDKNHALLIEDNLNIETSPQSVSISLKINL